MIRVPAVSATGLTRLTPGARQSSAAVVLVSAGLWNVSVV